MHYHNVSLSVILKHKESKYIVSNICPSNDLLSRLSRSIHNDLSHFIKEKSNYRLIVGNSFLYGYQPEEYTFFEKLEQSQGVNSLYSQLETSDLCLDESDVASATDRDGYRYTLFYLPVFIASPKPNISLIDNVDSKSLYKISGETLANITNYFLLLNISPLSLGYGYNDLLQDTLLNDFESLYKLEGLINNNEITIFTPYHFSFYEKDGITIALFKSMMSFKETFTPNSDTSLTDEYLAFTKNFRTGLAILQLLGRPYKIMKSSIMNDSIIDDAVLENPLLKESILCESSDYIVEKLDGNTQELLEVDNVEVDAYEDIQNGVIGVLVTWSKNNVCILRESVYPTKFETEDFVEELTQQIKEILPEKAALQVKTHDIKEVDDNTIPKL